MARLRRNGRGDEERRRLEREALSGDPLALAAWYRAVQRAGSSPLEGLLPQQQFEVIARLLSSGIVNPLEALDLDRERVAADDLTERELWLYRRFLLPTVEERRAQLLLQDLEWARGSGDLDREARAALALQNLRRDTRFAAAQIVRLMADTERDPYGYTPTDNMEKIAQIVESTRGTDAFDGDDGPLYVYVAWHDWSLPTLFWSFTRHAFMINTTRAVADRLSGRE